MDCWHILQIAPTSDERAIKRAYAKLLKTTRPDDDAEGYQRLREAFDEALAIAPYIESEAAPEWSFPASERLPENEQSEFRQNERSEFRQNGQGEFRQNKQSGFGQADSHHTLPPWQANSPDEHHTYRFSGSPHPDTTENERLPENGNPPEAGEHFSGSPHPGAEEENESPPEAFVYPFDPDIGDTFSGSLNPYGSDPCAPLLSNIETYFTRGGTAELEAAWPHIRERLEQLPLGETENASYQLADFLRTRQINDCMLWAQWSDYFGWHRPDVLNHVLSPAELKQLKEYRKAAAKLAKHRAKKANRRRKHLSANEIIAHIEDTFKRSGGKGLMRLWDSIAAEIAAASEEERTRVLAYLSQWLQQPYGLPEKLQNRWRQDYGLAPFHLETDKLQYWLEGWYAAGSSRKLAEKWPEIRALLNRMPANEKDKASAYCAAFIKRHNLSSSIVHTQWAAYFGWPDNETPPIEPGQSFSGSLHPYGGDPCAALLDDIESRFERGGVPELEVAWPYIRERLEQLPLGETENASYQLADFLRTRQINDCMLWAQWSDYFSWHRPDIRNNIFTPAELEQLKEYRRIAARLAKHRAQTQHTQSFVPPIGQATAQLLAQWRQWFKQGGSEELLRRWPETSRMLDNVPPQERSDVAAACLDFLHHNQIRHPLLWAHLADYPGWPHAFFQEVRDPEGLARLEEYRRTAGIIRLFEPEAARPDEDGGKPEERLPVSALFARFLGTQPGLMRRLFAAFAAMLLWPELSGEANRRQRWLLHTYRPDVHKRYDFWHGCRIAWVAVCFLIAIVSGIVVAVDAGWDKGFALTAAVFITFIVTAMSYGIYIMCASFLLVLLRLLWPSMEGRLVRFKHYSPWGKALYLLAFPITVALMLPASLDVPLWHGSVLAYMLSLTYYSTYDRDGSFAVKDASAWFKACLCMTGVLGLPITFPILQGYPQYLLAASLLWLNANLYLLFDRPGWLEKIEKPIRQLLAWKIGRKPWQWLLLPCRAAYAALLWLLLLPAQAARLGTSKEDSAWEIATGTLLLLALLPRELSAYVLLLIYPAAMLSALLRHIVQHLLLRGLRRGAGKTQAT